VVFILPTTKSDWSRVIGLPVIQLSCGNDVLIINGKTVEYAAIATELLRDMAPADRGSHVFATEQLPGRTHAVAGYPGVRALRDFGPIKVPGGQFFMMGDNRDDSFRFALLGRRERKRIIGQGNRRCHVHRSRTLLEATFGTDLGTSLSREL